MAVQLLTPESLIPDALFETPCSIDSISAGSIDSLASLSCRLRSLDYTGPACIE